MGVPRITMAFVPYARGYGYPYYAYGPTLEEVKKIREAEEKAFQDAEDKRKELIEAERKQYEKERELVKKLGGYPYAFGGAYGYGHPGYGAYGAGYGAYGAYGAYGGYGRGYGYPYRY